MGNGIDFGAVKGFLMFKHAVDGVEQFAHNRRESHHLGLPLSAEVLIETALGMANVEAIAQSSRRLEASSSSASATSSSRTEGKHHFTATLASTTTLVTVRDPHESFLPN